MDFKKIIAGGLSVVFLTGVSVGILSADDTVSLDTPLDIESQLESQEAISIFGSFSGTVKEIRGYYGPDDIEIENKKFVLVENSDGEEINFLVSLDETYFVTSDEIVVGANITGFYDATAPVLMIYPPQYNACVISVNFPEDQSIKVDKFDENLVSSDNSLKLNISDDTEIISQDGQPFEGDLFNRDLVVIYDISTKSIPAQTTPIKVVVLFERETLPIEELPAEEIIEDEAILVQEEKPEVLVLSESLTDIFVNGNKIDAPVPFNDDNGITMVPLRAVTEALGYSLTWNGEIQNIVLSNNTSLTIGKNEYATLNTQIQLEVAPVLINGTTFVPLSFFYNNELVQLNKAGVSSEPIMLD